MKNKKAFTLVELIVVITILAILGTIAFISLQGYSKSSRDSVRISDVSNMKTSLELFHLNSGKYPLPDDDQEVTFSGNTLWYQGEFGNTVISQLSRNINEIPTDPLTEKQYIYSVDNNKNEFEILALLESDLVLNTINQTNAAAIIVTPRIDGTFNGVFIQTPDHIIPVPSIINSEVGESELVLSNENIKSQVISNGGNIPNVGNVNYSTGELDGLVLSVYTGSIDTDTAKENAMIAIQDAYVGSELASDIKYANILSKTETEDIIGLFNTIVLGDSTIVISTIPSPYENCTGLNIPTPFLATTTYPGCDTADIIVCSGNNTGYTISACNVGATASSEYNLCSNLASCTIERVGGYFQFGRNSAHPTWISGVVGREYDWESIGWIDGIDDGSANYWGVFEADKTTTTYSDPLGSTNIGLMKGPCEIGYHIPTNKEWNDLLIAGGWGNNGINMSNALKLPLGGRYRFDEAFNNHGGAGLYWSSSPKGYNGYNLEISSTININDNNFRSSGFSIRCFKD